MRGMRGRSLKPGEESEWGYVNKLIISICDLRSIQTLTQKIAQSVRPQIVTETISFLFPDALMHQAQSYFSPWNSFSSVIRNIRRSLC